MCRDQFCGQSFEKVMSELCQCCLNLEIGWYLFTVEVKGKKEEVLVKALVAWVASIILPWIRRPSWVAVVSRLAPS